MLRRHALFLAIAPACVAAPAHAAIITVDSIADEAADNGECTLREAIENANSDSDNGRTTMGECVSGGGADEIVLPPAQTITLSSALPVISSEITLTGNGARIERSSALAACVLDNVQGAEEFPVLITGAIGPVALSDVTLANGCGDSADANGGGGGIRNETGPLSLSHVTLSGNSARNGGGVWFGTEGSTALTVSGSRFENNTASRYGAGIMVPDSGNTVSVYESDFVGQSATLAGGAIDGRGTLTLQRSTLRGNFSGDVGGGLRHNGALIVDNSTLSGNTAAEAGGGVFAEGSSIDIDDSSFVDNVAGPGPNGWQLYVPNGMAGSIDNSLFVGETSNCRVPSGVVGANIISSDSTDCGDTNRVERALLRLQPLGSNGGATMTHALGGGSVAIDAGSASCGGTDQRGVARPFDGDGIVGAICDVGAFESDRSVAPGPDFVVNALGDDGDGFCDVGVGTCTLRDAVLAANTDGANSTITFDTDIFASARILNLPLGEIRVIESLTLSGPGSDLLTIDAQQVSRHFLAQPINNDAPPISFTLSDMRLINGRTSGSTTVFGGGAVAGRGSFTLENLVLEDNEATEEGGGAFNLIGELTSDSIALDNLKVRRNLASGSGGGGLAIAESVAVTHSVFEDNEANRTTTVNGGGLQVRVTSGVATVQNSSFLRNRVNTLSSPNGGGLDLNAFDDSTVTVQNSSFLDNAAIGLDGLGGGLSIDAFGGTVLLDELTISGNSATDLTAFFSAGGLYFSAVAGTTATLRDSQISDNTSDGIAGGARVALYGASRLDIERTTISGNDAVLDGGGAWAYVADATAVLNIADSTISGNTSGGSGGGVFLYAYASDSLLQIDRSTITDNTADGDDNGSGNGGGLSADASPVGVVALYGSALAGNHDLGGEAPDWQDGGQEKLLLDSVIGNNTGSGLTEAPVGMPDLDNNLVGGPGNGVIDAQLGPLSDFGGSTFTHRPSSDSPLVDHYDGCSGIDQNGSPRGVDADDLPGNDCDVGAVEFVPTIFADGFETGPLRAIYEKRHAFISRAEVLGHLRKDGRPGVVLRAFARGTDHALLLVHGRRKGDEVLLQINRFEAGTWVKGRWQPLASESVELRW